MTRKEAETAIAERFKEILNIVDEYAPNNSGYFTMCRINGSIAFNNKDWDEDKESPISYYEQLQEVNND